MATGPGYMWSAKLILIKLMLVHTADVIVTTTSTGTLMSSTITNLTENDEQCSCIDCCVIIPVMTIVPTIVAISLVILILIWCQKRQTALINLTKHHKESDENSYTSSKHSHESGSKSPDPEYDVIKINPSTDKLEAHLVKSKSDTSCQAYSSVQSNILKHEEDWDCGPMYSSVDTNAGSPHKIGDFSVNSAKYTDIESHTEINADDITNNIIVPVLSNDSSLTHQSNDAHTKDNSVNPHIYAEVDIKKKKDCKNEFDLAVKEDEDSDEGSTPPPVPPQTTEMLAIQSEKVN